MKSKKIIAILIFTCIVISLTSCNSKQVNNDLNVYNPNLYKDMQLTIENHINYLTGNDCDGRLLGTDGNIKAQNYIRYCLEQYNIASFTDLYNSQFSYSCTDINKAIVRVNGKELKENIDFKIKNISNKTNEYTISDTLYKNNDGKIVMFETATLYDITQYANDHSFEVVLKKSNEFSNIVESKSIEENWLIINLSPAIYYNLKEDDKIDIECVYENKNKTANNIVGTIKSDQETKNAIVLSAHFDHMGSLNGNIYSGALDNASGCACLLELAKNLSSSIDTSKLNCDIIFAFFKLRKVERLVVVSLTNKYQQNTNKYWI